MSPKEAFFLISKKNNIKNNKNLEKIIAQDAYYSFWYAKNILKTVFPAGEKTILTNSELSYHYADDIIKNIWPVAEDIISENIFFSLLYASEIIKGPFFKAHHKILSSKYKKIYLNILRDNGYHDLISEHLI